ncbi:MAG TPA: hypothetical protein VIX12_10185, partial [Candidatus Binataceae bacterium]
MDPRTLLNGLTIAHSEALYLLAIPAAVLLWSLINASESRRIFAPIMRAIALSLFVLALANPEKVMHFEGAARPAIVDVSASITAAMRSWSSRLLRDELNLRPADPALLFATGTFPDSIGSVETTLEKNDPCKACAPSATNLQSALERLAADPNAQGGPAVLVTDGWENRGDAEHAISALVAARIRLDIFTPPGADNIPNVAMTQLTLPSAIQKAEPFALGITMENLNPVPVTGNILLYRNGGLLDQRKVTLNRGSARFDFPIKTENVGLASYKAEFKPDNLALDLYLEDDSLQGWVGVGARRKVLILTDNINDSKYLETVVRRIGLEAAVVPVTSGQWN